MPVDPPATLASGSALSPISSWIRFDGAFEGVGGDLREGRPGPGADVGGGDLNEVALLRGVADPRPGAADGAGAVGGARDAGTGQPAVVAADPRRRVAPFPLESPCAFAKAGDQIARRPRLPGLRIAFRLVSDAQLDWIDAARYGELVHRDFGSEHPRAPARGSHPRADRHVERRQPVRDAAIRSRVDAVRRSRESPSTPGRPRGYASSAAVLDGCSSARRARARSAITTFSFRS
jgi:hypothetical protein